MNEKLKAEIIRRAENIERQKGYTENEPLATATLEALEEVLRERGLVLAPKDPGADVWEGLPRDMIMWLDMGKKTPRALFEHLESIGQKIPNWLKEEFEMQFPDAVVTKGTRAVLIYRAMLENVK